MSQFIDMSRILISSHLNSSELSKDDIRTLLIVFLCTSTLAVFSQLFILIFYLIFINLKLPKHFPFRLIVLLAISDIAIWGQRIVTNIEKLASGYTSNEYSHELCIFEGFMDNFFTLMNILTTFAISFCLMLEVNFKINTQVYEKYFYIFIFLYSFIFSLIPIIKNAYGVNDNIRCSITRLDKDLYRYIGFYIHLWLIFILNCICLVIILCELKNLGQKTLKNVKKLIGLPIIMLIFWIEPSIRLIINKDYDSYTLVLLQFILMPMHGFANAIAYGLVNSLVKQKIVAFFKCDFKDFFLKKNEEDLDKINKNNNNFNEEIMQN